MFDKFFGKKSQPKQSFFEKAMISLKARVAHIQDEHQRNIAIQRILKTEYGIDWALPPRKNVPAAPKIQEAPLSTSVAEENINKIPEPVAEEFKNEEDNLPEPVPVEEEIVQVTHGSESVISNLEQTEFFGAFPSPGTDGSFALVNKQSTISPVTMYTVDKIGNEYHVSIFGAENSGSVRRMLNLPETIIEPVNESLNAYNPQAISIDQVKPAVYRLEGDKLIRKEKGQIWYNAGVAYGEPKNQIAQKNIENNETQEVLYAGTPNSLGIISHTEKESSPNLLFRIIRDPSSKNKGKFYLTDREDTLTVVLRDPFMNLRQGAILKGVGTPTITSYTLEPGEVEFVDGYWKVTKMAELDWGKNESAQTSRENIGVLDENKKYPARELMRKFDGQRYIRYSGNIIYQIEEVEDGRAFRIIPTLNPNEVFIIPTDNELSFNIMLSGIDTNKDMAELAGTGQPTGADDPTFFVIPGIAVKDGERWRVTKKARFEWNR